MPPTQSKASKPKRSLYSVKNDIRVDVTGQSKLEDDLRDYANGRERLASGISNEDSAGMEMRASDGSLTPEDQGAVAKMIRDSRAKDAEIEALQKKLAQFDQVAAGEKKEPEKVLADVAAALPPGLDNLLNTPGGEVRRPSLDD